jgi:tRNA(Ile)-lysidine synthase
MTSTSPVDPVSAAVNASIGRVGPGLYGVACSGGADSIALAHAVIAAAGPTNVVVISIDHRLQPGSGAVADGVARWAIDQGASAVVRGVDVEPRASVEAAARDARYAVLDLIADELGLSVVFLGHTARDQAETVLMRVIRGTGPAGIAGIPARRGRFVRPLLALPRVAIDDYVTAHTLPIAADPMNDDLRISRIRMRAQLLPLLRTENPQLDAALVRLAASATEWLEIIDPLAAPFSAFPIDCAALAKQPPAIRKRALARALEAADFDHEAVHLEELDRLVCRAAHGQVSIDLPGGRLVRSYDTLAEHAEEPLTALRAPAGPFELRAWRPGDRMKPARLHGKSRKLSDLYIDAKVPRSERVGARVVVRTTDGEIVWAEHLGAAYGQGVDVVPKPA